MQKIRELETSSTTALLDDIASLCTDTAFEEFFTIIKFVNQNKPLSEYYFDLDLTSAIFTEDNKRYPIYQLKFDNGTENVYIRLYVNQKNAIFKALFIDTTIPSRDKFN